MGKESYFETFRKVNIPEWELEFRADRSSGPGGQNVNKTATKITVHFDVDASKALNSEQKALVKKKLKNMINRNGELVLSEQSSRSQFQNRINAIKKLEDIVSEAVAPEKERKDTSIPKFERERRLKEKTVKSKKKESRRKVDWD